jgi:hypothetical protein
LPVYIDILLLNQDINNINSSIPASLTERGPSKFSGLIYFAAFRYQILQNAYFSIGSSTKKYKLRKLRHTHRQGFDLKNLYVPGQPL